MRRCSYSGGEHFHRKQECCAVRPDVEDELRDGEDRHESTGRCDVGYSSPDRVQRGSQSAEDELLADSAYEIWEEDSHVEGGQVACEDNDDVADRGVPESLEWGVAGAVADFTQYDRLIEVDAVISNVAAHE